MTGGERPEPLRSSSLERTSQGVARHGFFTRLGGTSEGIYRSLNIGVGSSDDPARVIENRRRVAEALGVEASALLTVHQIHSADVVTASESFPGPRPQADALVTDRPGLALGVASADCGPVLFVDAANRVIGAAHAGWKGALHGVLENTIAAMERLGARRETIMAELGPSIGHANYEVGPEFIERFTAADADNAQYFASSGKAGHALFDLNRYIVHRLRRAGIEASALNRCTYAEDDLFFSYRRATHRGEPDYGRQISAIVLEA